MATELTATAQVKSENRLQEPQLVVQIDGVETLYGIGQIKKFIRIGDEDLEIGDDWVIGGLNAYEDQLDVVDIDGSSNSISQQLLQDKGGTSSVSSIQVSLIDKNEAITRLITPSEVVDDILGRKASVYLGYQETAFPQDFVRIFAGVIDEIVGGTTIVLNVAHPEQKKRAELFQKATTELTTDFYYRAKRIQHIMYQTRRDVVGTVTVTYTTGATVGNEIVTVAGTNIVVQIDAGNTQARHIRDKIERSIDALSLVSIKVDSDFSNEPQTIQALTSLDSDTTINVTTTKGMLLPVPSEGFRTYVRINDEVIEYTGLTDTTITGCTRGAFAFRDERSEGATHEIEDTVDTFYRLEGLAFDLALKLMMSGGPQYFAENIQIKSIVEVEGVGTIPNALWFENLNIQDAWGVTVGDKVSVTGDAIPTNNVVDAEIADVVATPYGSYIVLSGVSLTAQILSTGFAAFASKWNVYPQGAGLGLGGDEVDVPEFERLRDIFSSSIFTYDFYLKDSVIAKTFIDSEILFPTGAFTLPRRGKISIGYTSPPLGSADVKVLDSTNTTKPQQTKIKRSINKYFYNNVLFKYNEAVVDELFLSGDLEVNEDSKARIPVGNKPLIISARGLRPSADASVIIEILKRRFQDKYKFGAEVISTTAFYGKTFNTDVGDVVVFGDDVLKLPDTKNGSRNFAPRLFEVANKSLAIKTGEVKLDLVDSGYSLADGRYGIISPASLTVAAGSGGVQLKIKNSFETVSPQVEKSKWTPYIGQRIIIHDENWDYIHETVLLGFSASDSYMMLLEDALPFTVLDDYVVDIAFYPDNANPEDQQISKRVFVFTNPTVEILAGISQTEFTVAGLDVSKFLVDAIVLVRDTEWDVVSPEVKVIDVTGSTITVSAPLGFVPLAGYEVDFIGFKDEGAPYRYL
jgi:hypothetical protein